MAYVVNVENVFLRSWNSYDYAHYDKRRKGARAVKTCPHCGYRDLDCWRNHRWIIYVTYCDISELEGMNPELAKEIIETGPTEQLPLVKSPFVYVLKKAGYVWRMDLEDYKMYGYSRQISESPQYRERIRLAEAQQRLPEVMADITNKEVSE